MVVRKLTSERKPAATAAAASVAEAESSRDIDVTLELCLVRCCKSRGWRFVASLILRSSPTRDLMRRYVDSRSYRPLYAVDLHQDRFN